MAIRRFATGGPISAAATVADFNGSGHPAILVGSDALYAWCADSGRLLPGFPVYGRNYFASRPLVVDLYGDGQTAIIVGCDDDSLYGFDTNGRLLPGFPFQTGGDIYSSPTAVDLNGDGRMEIIFGSDDGSVYILRSDSTLLPGWPRQTGGFVSASPLAVDLDADGCLEILCSSWDGQVYAWRADGTLLPGWPQQTGHIIWSAPRVADLTGDGALEVLAASEQVYVWQADGTPLPGWPKGTRSYVVGQPLAYDLTGDGRKDVITAADRIYAWDLAGRALPGFPLDLNTFFWSSPVGGDFFIDRQSKILACGWDGRLHLVGVDGLIGTIQLSTEPIFSTPVLEKVGVDSPPVLLVGSWDGDLCVVDDFQASSHLPNESAGPTVEMAADLETANEAVAPFIRFPGPISSRATMYYHANHGTSLHPVPLVSHRGQSTGLIQPYPAGTTVQFWAEIDGHRFPETGTYSYKVKADLAGRVRRKVKKMWSRR